MENIEYIKRIEFVEYEILGFIYKSSVSHENTYINVINHFEEGFRVDAQSVFYDLVRLKIIDSVCGSDSYSLSNEGLELYFAKNRELIEYTRKEKLLKIDAEIKKSEAEKAKAEADKAEAEANIKKIKSSRVSSALSIIATCISLASFVLRFFGL